jgi:tetratricopeptide (TPR) repeat protein
MHQAWIWAAAFNPDGTIVLTGGRDSTARLWDAATGMPLGPPIPHPNQVWTVAFSPDGKCLLTGATDHGERLFRKVPELPDDLDRVATWVELLTGLRLDPESGTIQALDNTAWRERGASLKRLGGPPDTGGGPKLDPILFGIEPMARGRILMQRGQWDEAEAAFDEVVRARPYNASSWLGRGSFHMARGQLERAGADFAGAIDYLPENLQIRYGHVLSLLALRDETGVRRACSVLLDRFGTTTSHHIANNVAWYCLLAPGAVANRAAPVRLAQFAVNDAPEAEKPNFLNTLGAALYRAGRSEEAIIRLEEGIRKRAGESFPQDWVFLAMAHHQLGHHAEAHAWLDRLRAYRANENPDVFWNELEIRLLRSEAESVILYDPAFPSDPFAL